MAAWRRAWRRGRRQSDRHSPRLAAAILFGAVHALMPGHGKTVLVSYHLGQPARPIEGFVNGSILAVTHVGLAVVLVLAGFAVISRAFAYGGRTPQFEAASGILIVLIGAFLLWRSLAAPRATSNRRQDARLGDRHDPLPPDDLRLELCAGARRAGGRLAVTAAMTLGMIAMIGGVALIAALARDPLHDVARAHRAAEAQDRTRARDRSALSRCSASAY